MDVIQIIPEVFSAIVPFISHAIESLGYVGITIFMALESMIFPVPSELIMPFTGFLILEKKMNVFGVLFFSLLGSMTGSIISYFMGYYGGKSFVLKFGKYALLKPSDLEKTEKWFKKSGNKTIFIGRLIPVVRHLISIPAGVGKMDFKAFCFYTGVGAMLWNGFLAYLGYLLGKNWEIIQKYSEFVSLGILFFLFLLIFFWIRYRMAENKQNPRKL